MKKDNARQGYGCKQSQIGVWVAVGASRCIATDNVGLEMGVGTSSGSSLDRVLPPQTGKNE